MTRGVALVHSLSFLAWTKFICNRLQTLLPSEGPREAWPSPGMALPNRKRTSSVRACSNPSEAQTERHKTSKWSMGVSTSTSGSAKNHRLHTAVTPTVPTPRTPGHADHNLHFPIVRACAPCICRLPDIFLWQHTLLRSTAAGLARANRPPPHPPNLARR